MKQLSKKKLKNADKLLRHMRKHQTRLWCTALSLELLLGVIINTTMDLTEVTVDELRGGTPIGAESTGHGK